MMKSMTKHPNKNLLIFAIPLFSDNYSYIVQSNPTSPLILIDPANPAVITHCLFKYFPQTPVKHILYTHKHWDHAGGAVELLDALREQYSNENKIEVYAGLEDAEHIPTVTKSFSEDSVGVLLDGACMNVYKVPCHTRGHTVYHFVPQMSQVEGVAIEMKESQKKGKMETNEGKQILTFESDECAFTGDTLFCGGVGRFFEGNAAQMHKNLNKIEDNLSENCDIFNGHEYTLQNLQWGALAEPENKLIQGMLEDKGVSSGECTLPTNKKREKEINVFYRAAVLKTNQLGIAPIKYMQVLRAAKNDGSSDLKSYCDKIL